MYHRLSLAVCLAAALISISRSATVPDALQSPCPETFSYQTGDKAGQWSGTIIARTEERLNGVWIRLIFDRDVKDLTVDQNGFEIKKDDDEKKIVRLQNRNLVLEARSEKIVKITVLYEGTEAPRLKEYRLNAKTVCPQANINRQDVFQGDLKSSYFLKSLTEKTEVIPKPTDYKCGVPHKLNPYPWQASIYINLDNEEQFICEATLISPNFVITPAHCVTFKKENTVIPRGFVTVYLGPDAAAKDAVKTLVTDIKVHPGYMGGNLLDDVALLKLASKVEVSDVLRPICLGATKRNDTKAVIVGRLHKEGQIGKLSKSNVSIVDFPECMKVAPHLESVLTYQTYCLSYRSDDGNCVGDSGSGLIVSGPDGVATLDGIVTLGVRLQNKKECDVNSIAVVVEVDRYLTWIKNVIYPEL